MRHVALVLAFALLAMNPGFAQRTQAKRAGPSEVPPVVHNGVKYVAIHWGLLEKLDQNGGYIEARDEKTDTRLWLLKVYTVNYDTAKERDVQDVFIKSMAIKDGNLIVVNERGERFAVDLKARKVTQLK